MRIYILQIAVRELIIWRFVNQIMPISCDDNRKNLKQIGGILCGIYDCDMTDVGDDSARWNGDTHTKSTMGMGGTKPNN
jgi:hypothetical protein